MGQLCPPSNQSTIVLVKVIVLYFEEDHLKQSSHQSLSCLYDTRKTPAESLFVYRRNYCRSVHCVILGLFVTFIWVSFPLIILNVSFLYVFFSFLCCFCFLSLPLFTSSKAYLYFLCFYYCIRPLLPLLTHCAFSAFFHLPLLLLTIYL